MTASKLATTSRDTAGSPERTDGLGQPTTVAAGTWRHRMRSNPGTALAWRIGVFVAGLLCVGVGVALAVLPGPLTIPPVLLGLWIWSTEFAWAKRFFDVFRRKADEAWQHAKRHPLSSTAITVGGILGVAAAVWAISHYQLIDQARTAVGL